MVRGLGLGTCKARLALLQRPPRTIVSCHLFSAGCRQRLQRTAPSCGRQGVRPELQHPATTTQRTSCSAAEMSEVQAWKSPGDSLTAAQWVSSCSSRGSAGAGSGAAPSDAAPAGNPAQQPAQRWPSASPLPCIGIRLRERSQGGRGWGGGLSPAAGAASVTSMPSACASTLSGWPGCCSKGAVACASASTPSMATSAAAMMTKYEGGRGCCDGSPAAWYHFFMTRCVRVALDR